MKLSSRLRTPIVARALPWALIGGLALVPAVAGATVVQVGSLAELHANDAIAWGQLVPNGQVAAAFSAPAGVVSNNGVGAVVSNLSGTEPGFSAVPGTTASSGFSANSGDPNDDVLFNCSCTLAPFDRGDLTINFATPVRGFGAYVQGGNDNYMVNVLVNGALSFTVAGANSITHRTYPFLGVLSDGLDIYSITFTSTSDADTTRFLDIDNLRLNTTPPSVEPPSSPTPEPATWAMLILGLAATGAALRRRSPRAWA